MTEVEMQAKISWKLKTMKDGEIRIIVRNGEIKHVNALEEIKEPRHSSENRITKF